MMKTILNLCVLVIASHPVVVNGGCPYFNSGEATYSERYHHSRHLNPNERTGDYGIPEGGYQAVLDDLKVVLTDSQDFFPADFEPPIGPSYGGLFIRLAWHCAGSFRESDGRGGCDGGRIRFDPELNWEDNANLDKALRLLEPIKEKYGSSLSWGDLIILSGNAAIESFGGPILGFCGGRIDDPDGANSLILGPSDVQEELSPCLSIGLQGQCPSPLGPSTIGLIYVNPGGPVDAPGDAVASGLDVRNIFSRMGFNDTETVALVGGGHAFGKCHGACPDPPCGEGPLQGIGPNTFTSGYEGSWTTRPTTWTNDYFKSLFQFKWKLVTGPGGLDQWIPEGGPDIIMLTPDIGFSVDPDYKPIAEMFAYDFEELGKQFMHSWYRLTTADMGPPDRCIGDMIPPPQAFQLPLPPAPETKPNYIPVRKSIQIKIDENEYFIGDFVKLAYNCAATFRETDYKGGCNGARIRFSPQSDWEINKGTDETIAVLEEIQHNYRDVSMADLIVLAGVVAIEAAGGIDMPFCGGRVDAMNALGTESLSPRIYDPPVVSVRDDMQVKGITPMEGVALFARPMNGRRYDDDEDSASNNLFVFEEVTDPTPTPPLSNQYFIDLKSGNGDFDVFEMALLEEEFVGIVDMYIANNDLFLSNFAEGWTKLMTADRYDGPADNLCDNVDDPTTDDDCEMSFVLWNADKDMPIGPISDHGIIDKCLYGDMVGLSIEAVAKCVDGITFELSSLPSGERILKRTEGNRPYMLGGDVDATGDVWPVATLDETGDYMLSARPRPTGMTQSVTFSVGYYTCH